MDGPQPEQPARDRREPDHEQHQLAVAAGEQQRFREHDTGDQRLREHRGVGAREQQVPHRSGSGAGSAGSERVGTIP